MIDKYKIKDDLYDRINSVTGKVDMETSNKISKLLEERLDLADMISSALSSNIFVRSSRVDARSNPAFPTVYFEVASRGERQFGSSAIVIATDGSVKLSLNSDSEVRDTLIKHIQNLMKNEQIKGQVQQIKELAADVERDLEEL